MLHLKQRLLGLVGQDQGLVVHLRDRLLAHGFHNRSGWIFAKLRVNRTQNRVLAHDYLVRDQCNQGPAGHGVVRYENGDFSRMLEDRARYLRCGQHKTTRCMQHQIQRNLRIG